MLVRLDIIKLVCFMLMVTELRREDNSLTVGKRIIKALEMQTTTMMKEEFAKLSEMDKK